MRGGNRVKGFWKSVFVVSTLVLVLGLLVGAEEILFKDLFDREEIGDAWTIVDDVTPSTPSIWAIRDNSLMQLSNIYRVDREYDFWTGTHIVAGSDDWENYELTCEVTANDDDGIGAIVRYQDQDNYYRIIAVADSYNKGPFIRLEVFEDGERFVLDEINEPYTPNEIYEIKFIANGPNLEVWINGDKVLSAKDNTFKKGKIGFLTYATESFAVTNVVVKKL